MNFDGFARALMSFWQKNEGTEYYWNRDGFKPFRDAEDVDFGVLGDDGISIGGGGDDDAIRWSIIIEYRNKTAFTDDDGTDFHDFVAGRVTVIGNPDVSALTALMLGDFALLPFSEEVVT